MINKNEWMKEIIDKLLHNFDKKLIFVGLQGSYQRGEATEESDFDVVVILDDLSLDDLSSYRKIVSTMPESDKACGFISGREELSNWPKNEIFQFSQETEAYYGDIIKLLPPNTEEDILRSIKIETANLYHYLCHLYVHGNFDTLDEELKQAYKSAFFIVQLKYYIDTKTYISSKCNLIDMIGGTEKEILKTNMNWNELKEDIENNKDRYFELLFEWCKKIICM
ncbi:nucleotidyltransferase domain-containing protein [Metaclostridioides mangenotii]|uniref:nucleotidyltransferase domain-containing protein n=1 Tax=Metaclostridioides mangenotii TaxID=1540 RepID=UPI00056F44A3|nr:nucleotidyltransferase domain-containing protein [Clostridioides mangenotii]